MSWNPFKPHPSNDAGHPHEALAACLTHWLRLKGRPVPLDVVRQRLALLTLTGDDACAARDLAGAVDARSRFVLLAAPQLATLPLLCRHGEHGWQVITSRTA